MASSSDLEVQGAVHHVRFGETKLRLNIQPFAFLFEQRGNMCFSSGEYRVLDNVHCEARLMKATFKY